MNSEYYLCIISLLTNVVCCCPEIADLCEPEGTWRRKCSIFWIQKDVWHWSRPVLQLKLHHWPGHIKQGCPSSFSKGPEPLVWAGSRAAFVQIKISVVYNIPNYCKIFILTFRNRASYIGRAHHYPPNNPFYIFFQQIYLLNFLNMLHTLRFFLFKMPFIS